LDGPLPKWCPAVALSHQDGHHSAVALLLKAALIQVSDYRLLGASGIGITIGRRFVLYHFQAVYQINWGNYHNWVEIMYKKQ
jgi:hypothetical protein